jgi:hypothetical protein
MQHQPLTLVCYTEQAWTVVAVDVVVGVVVLYRESVAKALIVVVL